MRISGKKLAEARVKEAKKELLKAKKELKEALICGPTGSFTSSLAHSSKIMGYTGLQEDEDFDADFDDDDLDFADTKTAIDIAFPEANPVVKRIIKRWYDTEGACEDFTDNSEFADYMKSDIEAMLDAADYPERGIVAKELTAKGYLEDDLWSMEESTKKPLAESENASDEKPFADVQVGDAAVDYAGNEGKVVAKGTAEEMLAYDTTGAMEEALSAGYVDFADDAIAYKIGNSDNVYAIVYGSDGAWVKAETEARVRQISFDFIDTGKEADSDLLLMVQDAMTRLGIEIVGGPAFGDTSWSKEEYGLKEEIIGKGKYGIEVKDPRGLWVPASENYPRNGEPAEFKKEDDAKNSDLYKRLVGRYGEDRVRTYRQG